MGSNENRLTALLGEAVKASWGELPQNIQELLFEETLRGAGQDHGDNDDKLRQQLALLLHARHPRTAEHA